MSLAWGGCRLHPRLTADPMPGPTPTHPHGSSWPPVPSPSLPTSPPRDAFWAHPSKLIQTLDSQALALCPLTPLGHTQAMGDHQEKPSKGYSPTFFLTSDMTPMRVSTCCLERPSRGTPSAKVSAPSAPGSHRCRMKRDT